MSRGGFDSVIGKKGHDYDVIGEKTIDGKTYQVVLINSNQRHNGFILIDSEGSVHNKALAQVPTGVFAGQFVEVLGTYDIQPSNVKFTGKSKEEVAQSNGYINYELIYNGRDKDSFHITYREFSPDNLARASFFQTLTYSTEADTIRFKKNLIQVHSVDNEKIVYTVKEDQYN
jgi:hypothetical protein